MNQAPAPLDPTPGLLVEAERSLVLPEPEVATSPPRGGVMPVGLPVWFWATNGAARSETAAVPGVSVTVDATAAETRVVIDDPGRDDDGDPVSEEITVECAGTGEAYDSSVHGEWDASDCSHVFDWDDPAAVEVSVTWALTWSSTTGASGTLEPVTRTTTFTLDPVELQAVTD